MCKLASTVPAFYEALAEVGKSIPTCLIAVCYKWYSPNTATYMITVDKLSYYNRNIPFMPDP